MGDTTRQQELIGPEAAEKPTGEEALVLSGKARAVGHLPDGLIKSELAAMREATANKVHVVGHVEGADTKRELSPEDQQKLLAILKSRFERNQEKLHPKTQWTHVEKSLQVRPDLMWSLQQLEATGGEPDVIQDVEDAYIFGDCSSESPSGRRNCVYDEAAEEGLAGGSFDGNAVDLVASFGTDLMDEDQYRALQRLIPLDSQTRSWLKTPANVRESGPGRALYGGRYGEFVVVYERNPAFHNVNRGFRAALRVPKAT